MTDILARINEVGLSPEAYLALFEASAATELPSDAPAEAREKLEFTRLNLHRTKRILRTWRPTPELADQLARLTAPQTWLVLTEPWCGDSAQCVPCLEVMARQQPLLTLKLVPRDQNLDLMDRYLTNGSRSIPRLVAFAPDGRELFRWGPRPAAAQAVFDEAKAAGLAKPELLEKLHLFYGRNRGLALAGEFVTILADLT